MLQVCFNKLTYLLTLLQLTTWSSITIKI